VLPPRPSRGHHPDSDPDSGQPAFGDASDDVNETSTAPNSEPATDVTLPLHHVEKITVVSTKEPTDGIVQTTSPDAAVHVDVEQ
jgi:hypothetical protein